MQTLKRLLIPVTTAMAAFLCGPAPAQSVSGVPTSWAIQNYVGGFNRSAQHRLETYQLEFEIPKSFEVAGLDEERPCSIAIV